MFTRVVTSIPMFSSRTQHILSFGLLAGLYMLFPNQNQGIDAWGYAAQIKWGQELFLHHHLLYNAFWYAMFQTVPSSIMPDTA